MRHYLLVFLYLFSVSSMSAQTSLSQWRESFQHLVDTRGVQIGAMVMDLSAHRPIFAYSSREQLLPASSFKVLTAATGLNLLGPNFRFETVLFEKPKIHHYYLYFSGDPSLSADDLVALFQKWKRAQGEVLTGKLVVDVSAFEEEMIGPGWMWDDLGSCFSAPVFGGNLDHNCFSFSVLPGRVGAPPNLQVSRDFWATPVHNEAVTRGEDYSKPCFLRLRGGWHNHYTLSGCIRTRVKSRGFEVAIRQPHQYLLDKVHQALSRAGILWEGEISFGHLASTGLKKIARHQSEPLSELVKTMLKDSDNLYAESLHKTLGARYHHGVGRWSSGRAVLSTWLGRHLSTPPRRWADGSGLSRYTLISARQFVEVFDFLYRPGHHFKALASALAHGGEEGTLKNRLLDTIHRRHVHAKTGTMEGVSSLVGIIEVPHRHPLAFAVLINGFSGKPTYYRQLEDDFVRALVDR